MSVPFVVAHSAALRGSSLPHAPVTRAKIGRVRYIIIIIGAGAVGGTIGGGPAPAGDEGVLTGGGAHPGGLRGPRGGAGTPPGPEPVPRAGEPRGDALEVPQAARQPGQHGRGAVRAGGRQPGRRSGGRGGRAERARHCRGHRGSRRGAMTSSWTAWWRSRRSSCRR